ncbi:MAG: hypothetical protein AB1505_22060, partial [Candidatus Latescibacterota bacterium]
PGGWEALRGHAEFARQHGCLLQGFVNPRTQTPDGPAYDRSAYPQDRAGRTLEDLSGRGAVERLRLALDGASTHGLRFDALYFDGYAAHQPLAEDWTPGQSSSRRRGYAAQCACFHRVRQRGMMAGGELSRFWCLEACDFFFYSDWASDRLVNTPVQGAPGPVGVPVPMFQLAFHDCCAAGFSGGGYAAYSHGYDWWAERTPRLYELLFAAAPAYNWLPGGGAPVTGQAGPALEARLAWLRRWGAFYRAVALEPMVDHRLSTGGQQQRTEFGSGAALEVDLPADRFRVTGVAGFAGEWEEAPRLAE